jgi:hypothetical protein
MIDVRVYLAAMSPRGSAASTMRRTVTDDGGKGRL